jgi:hypothetical protein
MLRDKMLKILLQQYLPQAENGQPQGVGAT